MMCYKDRTFCAYSKNCRDAYKCDRAITEQLEEDAKKANLYFSMAYFDKCYKPKES